MNIVMLVALTVLVQAVRSFSPESAGASAVALSCGFLLLAGFFSGRVFKDLGLPKLTGYLTAGIIFGPQVLDVVSAPVVGSLGIFKGVAVALLALTAGLEMHIPTIRPLFRSVRWIMLIAVLGTTVLLAVVVILARPLLPFLDDLETGQLIAIAIVLAITATAQSPAVAVAVRDETAADGPMVKTMLAVVVFADLVVIVLFAIATTLAQSTFGASADAGATALTLGWHVGGSILVGVAIGFLVALFVARIEGGRALFIGAVAFVIAEVGERLHLDPLVVSLAAGIFVRNFSSVANRVHDAVEAAGFPVYIAFFAIAGAGVHLDALVVFALPATIIVVTRGLGFWYGTRVAAGIAQAPDVVRRYGAFGLLPQAGLALALAALFTESFPMLGNSGGDLVFSIVAINEMVAPVLYRLAILRSGEAGKLAPSAVAHGSPIADPEPALAASPSSPLDPMHPP